MDAYHLFYSYTAQKRLPEKGGTKTKDNLDSTVATIQIGKKNALQSNLMIHT